MEVIILVLYSLMELIKKMRRRILPYMDDIVQTMESLWTSKSPNVRLLLAELVFHSADVIQYEMKDNLTRIIQLMVQMFETLRNTQNTEERKALRQLVKAIPKLGPIHEYFNFIIKPLATMLKSKYSTEELKKHILFVLQEGIALDSMPDYFMILMDALLDMIKISFDGLKTARAQKITAADSREAYERKHVIEKSTEVIKMAIHVLGLFDIVLVH